MIPTFSDQSKVLPFPKVTPIRLPEVTDLVRKNFKFYEGQQLLNAVQLESIFRDWYRPLVDIDQFPYMYFMNNGITQALEYIPIHFKNIDIKMVLGDYFWLKTIKSATEVNSPISCQISYDTNPSTIDGAVHTTVWNSSLHILDSTLKISITYLFLIKINLSSRNTHVFNISGNIAIIPCLGPISLFHLRNITLVFWVSIT